MIVLEHLTKEFDVLAARGAGGTIIATDRLNLEISQGEIFGLVGPNGAGKTTALKMVCGLLTPTSGRVIVNGVDVESQPEEAQRHIGYLGDFFGVYDDLKTWEYLDFFGRAYKIPPDSVSSRVENTITLLGLESKRDAFVGELSRGMKQRLGVARAILHDPPVLVLDEPASGLDPKARIELKSLIRELNRAGKTIFITSHVLSDLEEICTSIGILERGKLLRVGKLDQVMRSETSGRHIRIRIAPPKTDASPFAIANWLDERLGAQNVVREEESSRNETGESVIISFHGDEAELAELIRASVVAGAAVCGVEELKESLEQVFSRLSSGEVM